MKSSENKKQKRRTIKLFWKKSQRPTNDSAILINGKTIVFIACSIISGFINLVFITNLTKSAYPIGTLLSIPAAVLLGIMSIGLDLSKCLHSIQVNTLNELYRKLSDRPWAKKIKNVSRKWFTVYLLYVILSIITSVSLSTISITGGVQANSSNIERITKAQKKGNTFLAKGEYFENKTLESADKKDQNANKLESIDKEVESQVKEVWPIINAYTIERDSFMNNKVLQSYAKENNFLSPLDITDEIEWNNKKIIPDTYWTDQKNKVNRALANTDYGNNTLSGSEISKLDKNTFAVTIKNNIRKRREGGIGDSSSAEKARKDLQNQDIQAAFDWIKSLGHLGIKDPKTGKDFEVAIDEGTSYTSAVGIALAELERLRQFYISDSGDIGMSSKIFLQVGALIDGNKKSSSDSLRETVENSTKSKSFGTVETLMMAMLLFLSLLCELAINQFSPKTAISRKMLSQFSQYFPAGFDVNDFMLEVLLEQYNYGDITKAQFDKEVAETLSMMKTTKEDLLERLKKPQASNKKIKITDTVELQPRTIIKEVPADINNKKIDGLVDDIEKIIASEAS